MFGMRVWSPLVQWWSSEAKGKDVMVEHINRRLYSIIEIRRSFGRMMKKELDALQAEGVLSQDDAEVIARRLAFRFCAWDLHPPKRTEPAPDPVQVKAAIRSRLNGAGARMQFPDLKKLPAFSLEEMLRTHLKPRT